MNATTKSPFLRLSILADVIIMTKKLYFILLVVFFHQGIQAQTFDLELMSSEGKVTDTCDCHAALRSRETISFWLRLPEKLWHEEKLRITFMNEQSKKTIAQKTFRKSRDWISKPDGIYLEIPFLERTKSNKIVSNMVSVCHKKQDYALQVLIEVPRTGAIYHVTAPMPVKVNRTLDGKNDFAMQGVLCLAGGGLISSSLVLVYLVMYFTSLF